MSTQVHQRVIFRFGRETEVRYLARAPEVGDHVTRRSELWVISEVGTDELGGVLVTCVLPKRSVTT